MATNVCPRCRSMDLDQDPIMLTVKCHLCNWQGPVADCLAVTREGLVFEKVMERMIYRLSKHIGSNLVRGVTEFAREYGIRVRPNDLRRIVAKIVASTIRLLHDELLALAPRELKEKVKATNTLLAEDSAPPVPESPAEAPGVPSDLPIAVREFKDGLLNP